MNGIPYPFQAQLVLLLSNARTNRLLRDTDLIHAADHAHVPFLLCLEHTGTRSATTTTGLPCIHSDRELTPLPIPLDDSTQSSTAALPDANQKKKKNGILAGIVIAPLPIVSPAIGSGIIPVVGYIFNAGAKTALSPSSFVGISGLATNNGSRALAAGGQLYLGENTYRITSVFARGNIDYDVYGPWELLLALGYPWSRPDKYSLVSLCGVFGGTSLRALVL